MDETKLSKRKLKSYARAEIVCRALREHLSTRGRGEIKENHLIDCLISWMRVTGNIKYKIPSVKELKKRG